MKYPKQYFGSIARELDAQSAKLFLLLLSKADDEGYIKDTSLKSMHEETGTAVSTLSRTANKLKNAGILKSTPLTNAQNVYRLLPAEEWEI